MLFGAVPQEESKVRVQNSNAKTQCIRKRGRRRPLGVCMNAPSPDSRPPIREKKLASRTGGATVQTPPEHCQVPARLRPTGSDTANRANQSRGTSTIGARDWLPGKSGRGRRCRGASWPTAGPRCGRLRSCQGGWFARQHGESGSRHNPVSGRPACSKATGAVSARNRESPRPFHKRRE